MNDFQTCPNEQQPQPVIARKNSIETMLESLPVHRHMSRASEHHTQPDQKT